jgi:hypothetical protein
MNWSQIRKRLRDCLADELHERIDFHVAQYRTFGEIGRAWITVDGKQIASWSCMESFQDPMSRLSKSDVIHIMTSYLNASPLELLDSPIELERALALADKRTGKRSLKAFSITTETSDLVKTIYRMRTEESPSITKKARVRST